MRGRALIAMAIGLVGLVGCGSSDDSTGSEDTGTETTAPPVETTAAPVVETTVASSPETTLPPADDTTPAAGGGTVDVNLVEWAVEAPTEIPAGSVTFNVVNSGEFPHELVVVRGDSYETLPQTSQGAVDDAQLPANDFIGETARLGNGETEVLTVDLPAGNYVLFCGITGGGSSHAARGQVLSVTVA